MVKIKGNNSILMVVFKGIIRIIWSIMKVGETMLSGY